MFIGARDDDEQAVSVDIFLSELILEEISLSYIVAKYKLYATSMYSAEGAHGSSSDSAAVSTPKDVNTEEPKRRRESDRGLWSYTVYQTAGQYTGYQTQTFLPIALVL